MSKRVSIEKIMKEGTFKHSDINTVTGDEFEVWLYNGKRYFIEWGEMTE